MDNNEKTTEAVIVKEALAKDQTTITILRGEAPEQPQIYNPNPVDISGTIDAPKRFCEVRTFEKTKSHALVSIHDGTIKLIVNEQSTTDKFTIAGKIEIGKEYKDLGINNPEKTYTPEELAKKLKLKRNMFETKIEHAKLIAQLRGVTAKIDQEVEQSKSDGGAKTAILRQTVESNVPKEVVICIAPIEGMEPMKMELNVVLEADNGKLICTLESADGAEYIDEFKEKAVKEQVEYLQDKTTVIFV